MTMKVRLPPKSYTLRPCDVEMAHRAVHSYVDALEKYRGWVKDEGRPGADIAVENIDEEIAAYRALSLDLYDRAMKFAAQIVEREGCVRAPIRREIRLAGAAGDWLDLDDLREDGSLDLSITTVDAFAAVRVSREQAEEIHDFLGRLLGAASE